MIFSLRILRTSLLLLLLAGLALPALAQRAEWARSFRNMQFGGGRGRSTATDNAGNTYIIAHHNDTIRSDGGLVFPAVFDSLNRGRTLVAKFGPQGQLLWSRAITATEGTQVSCMTLSPAGEVYVAGRYTGVLTAGTATLPDTSIAFLVKYTTDGTQTWVRAIGSATRYNPQTGYFRGATIRALATDATGGLYVAGTTYNVSRIDALPMLFQNQNFILKSDANGVFQHITHFQGINVDVMTADAAGRVVFGGLLQGRAQFGATLNGPGTVVSSANTTVSDIFISRLAPAGTVDWVVPGRDTATNVTVPTNDNIHFVTDVTLDASGNAYLVGANYGAVNFDSTLVGQRGAFVLQVRPTGRLGWLLAPGGGPHAQTSAIVPSANGRGLFVTGTFLEPSWRLGSWTLPVRLGMSNHFLARLDTAGTVQWARAYEDGPANGLNVFGASLGCDAADNLYTFVLASLNSNYQQVVPFGYDNLTLYTRSFALMRFGPAARLTGTVFLDANANGVREAGEIGFPRPLLLTETVRGSQQTSGADGTFHFLLDTGRYVVAPPAPPAGYRLTWPVGGAGYAGHLAAYNTVVNTLAFGLAPIANQQDLRVTLTPYTPARRGIPTRYRARVENVGTTTVASGRVAVYIDAAATIIGTVPPPMQSQGQGRSWTFTNLAPFATLDYDLTLNVPLNVPVGAGLRSTANATPVVGDVTPRDNIDTLRQTVVGSFDPNDISVNYTLLTAAQIAAQTPLDYVVRFQNMGTDTAFAVVIQDTLPAALLQLSTIELMSQSHNVQWQLSGPGLLTIRFPGIRLPQRAVDAVRSQGFVRFRITPRATLVSGTLIPNEAHITFDFNAPVTTNQVTTLVQSPNGLVAEPGAAAFRLYPNPTDRAGQVTLTAEVPTPGAVTVTVLDVLAREARPTAVVAAPAGSWTYALPTTGLAPGVYAVRLTLPGGASTTQRLVVR